MPEDLQADEVGSQGKETKPNLDVKPSSPKVNLSNGIKPFQSVAISMSEVISGNKLGQVVIDSRESAIIQGYTGDSCVECGSFQMVRNGSCLKCLSCGATTGCS